MISFSPQERDRWGRTSAFQLCQFGSLHRAKATLSQHYSMANRADGYVMYSSNLSKRHKILVCITVHDKKESDIGRVVGNLHVIAEGAPGHVDAVLSTFI